MSSNGGLRGRSNGCLKQTAQLGSLLAACHQVLKNKTCFSVCTTIAFGKRKGVYFPQEVQGENEECMCFRPIHPRSVFNLSKNRLPKIIRTQVMREKKDPKQEHRSIYSQTLRGRSSGLNTMMMMTMTTITNFC